MKNEMVVRNFVAGKPGNGSNLLSTGKELINYSTVIARNDNGTIYLNEKKYSHTTTRIQNMVKKIAIIYKEMEG